MPRRGRPPSSAPACREPPRCRVRLGGGGTPGMRGSDSPREGNPRGPARLGETSELSRHGEEPLGRRARPGTGEPRGAGSAPSQVTPPAHAPGAPGRFLSESERLLLPGRSFPGSRRSRTGSHRPHGHCELRERAAVRGCRLRGDGSWLPAAISISAPCSRLRQINTTAPRTKAFSSYQSDHELPARLGHRAQGDMGREEVP
ncbi:uncharacterized protein LOC119705824 [Motacilla alba alba]|uniref:uncharacterized protein LOC119705824 n=1 Tax=Motacilla alba alba TaxID=1094192 RepID=UPI0018D53A6B|nr:uncharacterized protein LOC119705824 [Motacilla alba alba]